MFKSLLTVSLVICLVPELAAQEMSTPSQEHEIVMKDVGEWNIRGKMLMPDGFQEFKGEEKVVAIGKFWTVSHFSSDIFSGLEGSTTLGFDPGTKKFIGTWVDSFQPAATKMKGLFYWRHSRPSLFASKMPTLPLGVASAAQMHRVF